MRAEEQKREKYLPTLLVQQIRLQWYKDCRGGNAAAQRNQYPRAMRLPKDFFSYYPFGLPTHFASIIQRPDGFQIDRDCRRLMEWKPNGTMRLHPFELIQQESGIQVRYRYDWHIGAMPERYTYDILPGMRNESMLMVSSFPRQICSHGNCSVTGIPAMLGGCTTSTGRSRGRIGTVSQSALLWTRLYLSIIWPVTKTIFTKMMR